MKPGSLNPEASTVLASTLSHCSAVRVALLVLTVIAYHLLVLQDLTEAREGADVVAQRSTRTNPQDGLDYVSIPPGTFQMGCSGNDKECKDHEKPSHAVTITRGFWIGKTEVTVGAYRRFLRATGRSLPPEPVTGMGLALNEGWRQELQPIVQVTWEDGRAYCEWAGGRLPIEAEWEYAARGGTPTAHYGTLEDIAWYADTSGRVPVDTARIMAQGLPGVLARTFHENRNGLHEVALKKPNAFDLYDTLGNAWEWVADRYDEKYYGRSPSHDPTGPSSGQSRVLRGGGWNSPLVHVRVSDRIVHEPGVANIVFGYRCVWERP